MPEQTRTFLLFQAAIEAIGDAVVVTTPNLDMPGPVIEYVNPAFTAMTGYAAAELIGETPRLLQGPATDRTTLDRMRATLAAGGTFQGEAVNYRRDGQSYIVDWLITPIKEAGRVLHWLSVQQDITKRRHLEQRQGLLVAELHHRTRNLLAVVRSIAARNLPLSPARNGFDARLAALGRMQDLLSSSSGGPVALADLVTAELAVLGNGAADRVLVQGPRVELSADRVLPIALAVHELAVNAVKHGAIAQLSGFLAIRWRVEGTDGESRLVLVWHESGVVMPANEPAHRGYGRELLERALPYQLGADVWLEFGHDGVQCKIVLPADTFVWSGDP